MNDKYEYSENIAVAGGFIRVISPKRPFIEIIPEITSWKQFNSKSAKRIGSLKGIVK